MLPGLAGEIVATVRCRLILGEKAGACEETRAIIAVGHCSKGGRPACEANQGVRLHSGRIVVGGPRRLSRSGSGGM